MDRIGTRSLGDPSDPKVRMVPLYHGCPNCLFVELHQASFDYLSVGRSGKDININGFISTLVKDEKISY
ncbi:hypothetical protein E2C01_051953 [Portunus trituberculatus]|uniref:Uncharacterized protein n=1 Tax=Portunus trituberculatus TaxID=210409 RepID=A0A5B7GD58_PORTR|nr:hypothetical protein [Portunus trituberculatus]